MAPGSLFTAGVFLSAVFLHVVPELTGLPSEFRVLDLTILLWLIYAGLRGLSRPSGREGRIVEFALLGFVLLTVFVTVLGGILNPGRLSLVEGIAPGIRTMLYASVFWLAYDGRMRGDFELRSGILVLVGAMTVHFVYAIIQFLAGTVGILPESLLIWEPVRQTVSGVQQSPQFGAATGLTSAVFVLSGMGAVLAVPSGALLFSPKSTLRMSRGKRYNGVAWFGLAIGFGMILLSFRRSPLVALSIAVVSMACCHLVFRRNRLGRVIRATPKGVAAFVVLGGAAAAAAMTSDTLRYRLESLLLLVTGDATVGGLENLEMRFKFIRNYWSYIVDHPIGIGLYPTNIRQMGVDNAYVTYLAQGGPFYAASYIVLLTALAGAGVSLLRRGAKRDLFAGTYLVGWATYTAVVALVANLTLASQNWAIVWWVVGVSIADVVQAKHASPRGRLSIVQQQQRI